MSRTGILERVEAYFRRSFQEHGATPRGVDWNSPDSQRVRFRQLMRVCDTSRSFSITDLGSGYGALAEYLREQGHDFSYQGYDICEEMIETARQLYAGNEQFHFHASDGALHATDYAVASGVFNVKGNCSNDEWQSYVLTTLDRLNDLGRRGFAFNLLTSYSDAERMRADLYYANPLFFFDHCKVKYSRQVALLHDYGIFDFTILVRKP